MARGRFISRDIVIDKKVNSLSSPWSMLAFTWLITHADIKGRTHGDPAVIRSTVFPRHPEITVDEVEGYIKEWVTCGLVNRYEVEDDLYIEFPNFFKHQTGLRPDREPTSTIPANPKTEEDFPEDIRQTSGNVPEDIRQTSGNVPEDIRMSSGSCPAEVKEKLREVKEKLREGEGEGALSPVQQMIESVVGISPANAADLQALEEITALNPSLGDIQDAYNWLCRQGKQVKYYSSLVGPVRTSVTKREQIPKSPLDKSKAAILQVLQEIKNGVS